MAQRTSATLALGGLAGGLAYLSSGSQAFAAAPATTNLRQQHAAHAAQAPASSASTSLPAMMAGGAVLAAAAASGRTSRSHGSTPLPTTVPVRKSATARKALDQSSRYADLSLDEATLIKNGKHVLVAYIMKPKAGYDYLATAAHFAAESSTGTNVNVCTTDDFTKSVDALVYYIDPDSEEMKIAYPNLLFDRNIIDGRAMMCSFLTLSIGNNQGMGDVEYGKIYDFYLPPEFLRLYDGPAVNVEDMWRILGKGTSNGGLVVGTIIKPKLGLQPKPFGEACYAFWQGGDFIKNDEPQGNQVFCQMNEVIPEVVKAMRACIKETGVGKLFSANITADDPNEMIARGKYCLSQFGPLSENCAFLVDGYVAGGTAVTCARRNFPGQFLHYHRAGHGSVTSPQTQRGYTAFVHTKISRVIGASGIHTGTMSFGKMEGDASDKNIAFMLQDDAADGPYYHQPWEGMKQTTPIISGGMNALRLPAFFENLGHSNVILTAGGGSFGHKDGPKPGAVSCRQGEEAWKAWKSGQYGNISLSDGVIEFAKTHEEIKGAFLTFQKDADQIYPGWKEKLGYTGESSVQAASFDWAKKASAAAFVGASVTPAKKESSVSRKALDQSSRYADLSLDEATLIKNGKHVLVAYIMKPKAGYDYLATAAHFAAESSTGTNVNVCTTDDFTKSVDALVYYIDPDSEEMKIAYPNLLFDRNIIDGRAMMCSFLTLSIGNNQGMGDVEYGKIYDFYLPPEFLRLYDGPAVNVEDMWRILGKGTSNGGLVVGTIIKPKLGLQPKPFGEACYAFWQGGDFIKNDEPQGNQVFCQMNEVIPEVVKAMRACIKETGVGKLFSANITADDPNEMIARGKYCLSQFGPLSENCAFLVDGYVAGGTAVTCARRNFPGQFLHYHRAGHGSVTSPQTQRGYTAFVHTKISRVIGASGIHTGTMSFGKMEGDASDKNIAFMLQDDAADGPYYHQPWEGMKQTTPIISGGMNALRLPAFFENLGHSNVILTAGGGSFGHKDGPKPGAVSCRQGEEAWKAWKAGQYGNISLSDGVIEFAKTHEEIKGAFLTFQKDADQIYPGWKEKLGYTGESSVQAASFDWAKKASAAAFVGCSVPERTVQVARAVTPYELQKKVYADLEFTNDVGYLPDGTPMNRAGNAINHPETIGPDRHAPGSPLPRALFVNSVGYLPDGTPLNAAGNAINHPETMQPDSHTPGSPLPVSAYAADIGYLVDGTPMQTAGNNSVRGGATPAAAPAAAAQSFGTSAPPMAAASHAAVAGGLLHGRQFDYSFQKDVYADLEFSNDVGYLPDGTPMNRAGNAINHPENIQPDRHTPGSPLPRAEFVNSVGYLPDGTPLNAAGNAINHPETMQPDLHTPGSPLPASAYAADIGYLVDGTPLESAGNNSVKAPHMAAAAFVSSTSSPSPAPTPPAPAFAGSSAGTPSKVRHAGNFAYSFQKDSWADLEFSNDIGYLPDGTPMNKAGNAINHPENIQPDSHAPGSPLPSAIFVNDVGYLPDGTPLNKAGNAINHPENIQPDLHTPGSPLPASVYAQDVGYLVDGTPMSSAGNLSVQQ